MYTDVLEAECVLYGEYDRTLSVRRSPGGEDRLDDLAQAWIDGDRDRVMEFVKAHNGKVRD